MKRLIPIVLLALPLSAEGQVTTLPGDTYQTGTFAIKPHGATGCPSASCNRAGALALATDRSLCICNGTSWGLASASTAAVTAHIEDAVDAHDASAISVLDSGNWFGIAVLDVEAALQSLGSDLAGAEQDISTHTSDTNNPHNVTASQISVTDTAEYFVTDEVESALAATMGYAQAILVTLSQVGGAASIGVDATGLTYAGGPFVQDSIADLDTAIGTLAGDLTSHSGSTSNPHSVTAAQTGAVALSLITGADQLIRGTAAGTADVITIAASEIPCKTAAGSLSSCAAGPVRNILGIDPSSANQIPVGNGASSYTMLDVAASTLVGRTSVGDVDDLSASSVRTILELDSSANGKGASLIALEDAAANFTTDNVEAALAQLAAASGGTPAPVYLGHLSIDAIWEQAQSTNIQSTGGTYDWSTTGRSFGFFWPYTRLTAAHASWGLEVQCRIAAAQVDTAVAFDCKNRAGTEYCTEWTDSTWTGSLTEESSTITFSGSLPTGDDFLFIGWHSDGTDILRVFYCAAFAVPL